MRKTKIICTLGPSTDKEGVLRDLIANGMNVARFNFSHGSHEEHLGRLEKLKALREELGKPVAALLDTKGPEIRLKDFKNGVENLVAGQTFTLTTRDVEGTKEICSITYKDLPMDVEPNGTIMLDDGLIKLQIQTVNDTDIVCTVLNNGKIKNKKGVNVPGVHLSMPYMSQRDKDDIIFGIQQGYDFIAASFVRTAQDVYDIRNLLIKMPSGQYLKLGDVAEVRRELAEPQRNAFYVDGKPAVAVCVAMEADAIVPDVGKAVDARLDGLMKSLPAGFAVEKIFFQPDKVEEAINSFMLNLIESVGIVILVLVFTMGFRSGAIIGFGLVLTIAVSFPILLMGGTTLQRISLGAFIVAMGMLVDNAIVIMDGILIDKKRGLPQNVYLSRIGKNTAMPLLGATVIAASTFLCVFLSPDSAGEYARDLFLVLCVSLLASWALALVQVPICAKSWLPKQEKTSSTTVMNSPVHRFVRRAIALLIDHKKTTLAVALVALLLSVWGMTKVKNLFFPDFDYRQFIVECYMPSQTDPDKVRDDLLDMGALLRKNPKVERVAVSTGSAPAFYCLVRPMTSGGDCYGELMVDCADYATVVEEIPKIRRQLREAYPDAYIRIRKYNFSVATSHPVEVEFRGPDPAVLRNLSRQAEDIMRKCPYVDPYSVENNWKAKGKNLVAEYVQSDGLRAGIARGDVGKALQAATDGLTIGLLNDQNNLVPVNLLVRKPDCQLARHSGLEHGECPCRQQRHAETGDGGYECRGSAGQNVPFGSA